MGLAARRGERELREERERALRLERELEGWKGLRFERRAGSGRGPSWGSGVGSVRGRREGSVQAPPSVFAREGSSVQPSFAREASAPAGGLPPPPVVVAKREASGPAAVVGDAEAGAAGSFAARVLRRVSTTKTFL
jgi:myosin protein heavy chain